MIESTPEESIALKITEKLADTFLIETPAVYVFPDEVGVNALTAGFLSQRYCDYFNVGRTAKPR